ncbi:MAG: hypothetical protein H6709_23525 [Kofleriaceae bacterium]|nr:hypothetical protein [Myxococcales bacterium]MCB9559147.1 hypothetical protein [Kofleriaceae bacterium]MCB9575057.1 hypothetical protein [Kofleriaceae bacterium]
MAPAFVVGTGCGGDDGTPLDIEAACNPLGGVACMMPWPSMVYAEEDASTETGYRVAIPEAAMPSNTDPVVVDPTPFNRFDGFSPSGPILANFPGGVSAEGLPPLTDPAQSLEADSPVILLDMDRGERAVFFAEVDMSVNDPASRPIIIRPMVRLKPNTRYAVGIRKTVKSADGGELPVPPAFAALRDGTPYNHPMMAKLTPRYDAIFAALEGEGVSKDELLVAWDFVTASDASLTSDLLAMRADAVPAMGSNGANLGYDLTEFAGDPTRVHKLVVGTIESPDFLTNGEADSSILRRDDAGRPLMQGKRDANFTAIVPQCVETAQLPIPVMVFGHGLFGSGEGYLNDRFLQQVAQDYCFVVVAGDWIGLTERQIGVAALAANDLNKAGGITEKLAQSVIDFISIETISRGPLHDDAMFAYNGTPVIDPSRVYYFGASLGGIMGTTFMAYDQQITRGVLGVPGGPWTMLFERSYAWNALSGPAKASYPDPTNFQMMVTLLGWRFEPYDPITAAPHVINDPLPDTPEKQILMYEAMADSLVTNISSETLARTMGLQVVMPSVKQPYGLAAAPATGPNGFSVYDEVPDPPGDFEIPPPFNLPPQDDNGTHGGVHERPAVLRQIEAFLYDGVVSNQCQVGGTPAACSCVAGNACE